MTGPDQTVAGWSAARVRAAEEPLLAAGVPLMQRAATALAVEVAGLLRERRGRVGGSAVVLLVGGGNNGGDTLHAGALLARRGAAVLAVLTTARPHAEGLAALRGAGGRVVSVAAAVGEGVPAMWLGDAVAAAMTADVVLDGLVGLGGRGPLRGVAGDLVGLLGALLDADRAPGRPDVVAVDLPSGVDPDDGTVPPPATEPGRADLRAPRAGRAGSGPAVLCADVTVTFGRAKAGLLLPPADRFVGRLVVADIGLDEGDPDPGETPAVLRLGGAELAALWPVPEHGDDKYRRGVLGVVAGSARYPGAAVLTVGAAVRAGAGMVRYLGPCSDAVLAARPEAVPGHGRVQAWAVGPGLDVDEPAQVSRVHLALRQAVEGGVPVVVDAGALDLVPEVLRARRLVPDRPGRRLVPQVVLTPHAGELARLLTALAGAGVGADGGGDGSVGDGADDGDGAEGAAVTREHVEANPLAYARAAVAATGATVLLKGPTTLVVSPDGAVQSQADAPAWLGTAGAGDVLTGLLGALLAARADEVADQPGLAGQLAAVAAAVHGRAAAEATRRGGPIAALDVVEALPRTVARLLG